MQCHEVLFVLDLVGKNLADYVICNDILALCHLRQLAVNAYGTLLPFDGIFQNVQNIETVRCVISAVCLFEPLFGMQNRGSAQLDDPVGHHSRMAQFVGRMLV